MCRELEGGDGLHAARPCLRPWSVSHCYAIQFIAPPEIRDAEEEEEQEEKEEEASARIWRQTRVNQTAAAASCCLRCVACSLTSDRPSDLHLNYNYIA